MSGEGGEGGGQGLWRIFRRPTERGKGHDLQSELQRNAKEQRAPGVTESPIVEAARERALPYKRTGGYRGGSGGSAGRR